MASEAIRELLRQLVDVEDARVQLECKIMTLRESLDLRPSPRAPLGPVPLAIPLMRYLDAVVAVTRSRGEDAIGSLEHQLAEDAAWRAWHALDELEQAWIVRKGRGT